MIRIASFALIASTWAAAPALAADHAVTIASNTCAPQSLVVQKGDTVTFTNKEPSSVIFGDKFQRFPFLSIDSGKSGQITFDRLGFYMLYVLIKAPGFSACEIRVHDEL